MGTPATRRCWFTLPWTVATEWTIYVRELGKPGGTGDIVTCGISDEWNSRRPTTMRSFAQPLTSHFSGSRIAVFRNVTRELTTILLVHLIFWQAMEVMDEVANLFDPDFFQYFWDYDNNGLRLVQLRFYPVLVTMYCRNRPEGGILPSGLWRLIRMSIMFFRRTAAFSCCLCPCPVPCRRTLRRPSSRRPGLPSVRPERDGDRARVRVEKRGRGRPADSGGPHDRLLVLGRMPAQIEPGAEIRLRVHWTPRN